MILAGDDDTPTVRVSLKLTETEFTQLDHAAAVAGVRPKELLRQWVLTGLASSSV